MSKQHEQAYSIGGLELLASLLAAQNNMRVVFYGDKTQIDLHSKPMTLYLPADLANTESNRLFIEAKIDHETAHTRFTSPDVPNWHDLVNRLEDVRIERLMGERYPGSRLNLYNYRKAIKPNLMRGTLRNSVGQNILLMIGYSMRAEILQQDIADYAEDARQAVLGHVPDEVVDAVLQLSREASLAVSTEIVSDKVEQILAILQGQSLPKQTPEQNQEVSAPEASDPSQNATQTESDDTSDENAKANSPTQSADDSTSNTDAEDKSDAKSPTQANGQPGDENDDESENKAQAETDSQGEQVNDQSFVKTNENVKTSLTEDDQKDSFEDPALMDWMTKVSDSIEDKIQDEDAVFNQSLDRDCFKSNRIRETPRHLVKKYAINLATSRRATNQLRGQLGSLLQATTYADEVRAVSGGRLDRRVLHTLRTPNPKPFLRTYEGQALSTSIMVLVDASGSMEGNCNTIANESAYALCEAMHHIESVECACAHFRGNEVILAKSFNEQPEPNQFGVIADSGTPLDMALHWSFIQLWPRPKDRKIIIFLTDGDIPVSINEKISFLKKQNIECYGIGLDKSLSHLLPAKQQVMINEISQIPSAMFKMLRHALFK